MGVLGLKSCCGCYASLLDAWPQSTGCANMCVERFMLPDRHAFAVYPVRYLLATRCDYVQVKDGDEASEMYTVSPSSIVPGASVLA
jgi:hypothetical protein